MTGSRPSQGSPARRVAARTLARWHLIAAGVWLLLAIPTLTLWRDSLPWLVFMSIYAIVAAHLSGYQGARAEEESGSP